MLYYNFRNFEEFKELFGMQHHGNGEKSRKNKILLSYIKNKSLLHNAIVSGDYHLLHISSMAELKQQMNIEICRSGADLPHEVTIRDNLYHSSFFRTDEYKGICEDSDPCAIRYINVENGRVFKMKIGKFYRKLILETSFGQTLPPQVITYLCEEMTQDWQTYTMSQLPKNKLLVNREFGRIYDSSHCEGDFSSCMVNHNYHSFYADSVDASAAYLENDDGKIIARCIIYNHVTDQDGKVWRLAERQYSTGCNDILKRALVDALVKGGHIDGYKSVGAGCSDSRAFVDNEGNSLSNYKFSIECNLDYGDTLSYQDSFKNYDMDTNIATNFGEGDIDLDTTNGEIEDGDDDRAYDDYHDEYCDETTTVYYHGREYSCDSNNLADFRWVVSEQEYYHEDDVYCCEQCGDYVLTDNSYFSEITEEYYCCEDCMSKAEQEYKENNWTYSDYDEEYYEDEDDVTTYMQWMPEMSCYIKSSISTESLEEQIDSGDFYCFDSITYDAIDPESRLPYGMCLIQKTENTQAA